MVLLLVGTMSAFAQNKSITVSGRVIETETKDPVEQATIRLLSLPDSAYVTGGVTQARGRFALPKVKSGKYVLVISYIGLQTKNIPLQLSVSDLTKNVGVVALNTDAIQLKEAVVTAEAPQVTVSEDTLVFNSSAYRVPQGAMLEELVKKLPGAEVADDGTITINGKTIKKIMLNGKEFFSQDTKVAMKNLPVEMIDKVKSYDKKSDLARITGIDDGDEETVIDLTVKKGMNQGWFGNLDLGAGDQERYLGKMMLNRFSDGDQLSLVANSNNINDQGFPGGGGFRKGGSSNSGINAMKTTGINFAHDTNKLELGGNVDYSHTDKDIKTSSLSESFLQNASSFSKGLSSQMNKSESLSADFRMEWKPDSLTNIIFRPSLSYSSTNNNSNTRSLVSDSDVLSGYDLNTFDFEDTPDDAILVNSSIKETGTQTKALSTDGNLQINRKLNKKGRNITLRLTYGYSDDDSDQSSDSKIRYHRFENDSAYISNQFISNKNNSYNYKIQTTYSEPIFTNRFLQFSYSYQYKYQETDKKTYDYTDKGNYLNNPIASLSKYYENKYNTHEFNLSFKTVREKYQYNIGFSVQPQQSTTSYLASIDTTITRNVVNLSPTFDYRYRFNKQSQLRINYRGKTSQPSMTDLLPITDESDPLNITEGNPSLKPSYSNNFMLFYNTFLPETQQSMMLRLSFTNTSNSVSNMVTYNEQTGGKTTRPENINGNWSTNGGFVFTTPLKNKKFTLSTFSDGSYNNMVSYTSLTNADAVKNTTRSLSLSERLNGTFRNDWFDFGLNSGIQYNVSRSSLQSQANKETFDYSFGASTNITLPWSMSLATDVSYSMRNGYSSGLDRNELIWNAQVAKSFLNKKQATISFQIYDILKEQSNLSRSISASMRQDTEYNAINSYFMFHFIYRLNAFGGNKGKGDMDRRGGPDGPPRNRGDRGGGGRPF